jgi:NitT/TauT family transport system ATP-binding protein
VERLVRAVAAASAWCSRPDNRDRLAGHVAAACGDMDAAIVARLLAGQITVALPDRTRHRDDFLILGAEALPPDPAHAEWLHGRIVEAGQARGGVEEAGRARAVYRLDRFGAALGTAEPVAPFEPGVFAGR